MQVELEAYGIASLSLQSIDYTALRLSTIRLRAEYASKHQYGAHITLPQDAYQEYITDASTYPDEYIRKNYSHWKTFFNRNRGLKYDPVFVCGCTKTTDWVIAASNEVEKNGGFILGAASKPLVSGDIHWKKQQSDHNHVELEATVWAWALRRKPGPVLQGTGSSSEERMPYKSHNAMERNQCIFVDCIDAKSLGLRARRVSTV